MAEGDLCQKDVEPLCDISRPLICSPEASDGAKGNFEHL